MTPPAAGLDGDMLVAAAILAAAYALIFTEVIHRTSAALIGALVMVGAGMAMGFYSQEAAIRAIDANTLLLLAAMMMLVAMLRPTGAFDVVAIVIARAAAHDPRRLLLYLSLAVSLISTLLDNVTVLIVFAPLTVLIARILEINPLPLLMSIAILSNVGGTSTLVGDPPNIIIGSAAGLGFTDFLLHMGPPVALIWLCTVALLLVAFRRDLDPRRHRMRTEHFELRDAVRDRSAMAGILAALLLVVVLLFLHPRLQIFPAYAALLGLGAALLLVRPRPEPLFGAVNWSVLAFFAGLFVIVGGVESTGLLTLLGQGLATLAADPDRLLLAGIALMWLSAFVSALIDNIPFTIAMIPVLLGLEAAGAPTAPLWWALALGVGLGGNTTHVGATANLIAVSESERCGIPGARISPLGWMRVGIPVTLVGLVVATTLYTLFFDHFAG